MSFFKRLMEDARPQADAIREKTSNVAKSLGTARTVLSQGYFKIEDNPTLTDDEKVQRLIYVTSAVCGVVAMQPLPFADIFALTPIQIYMGYKIGKIRGIEITEENAGQVLKEIAGAVGLGFAAQQGALGLYKLGLPFIGGFMTFPLVAGLTTGIGKTMDVYFRFRAQGRVLSKSELRKTFDEGRKEGKRINPDEARATMKQLEHESKQKEIFNSNPDNQGLREIAELFFPGSHFLDLPPEDQEVVKTLYDAKATPELAADVKAPEGKPDESVAKGISRRDGEMRQLRKQYADFVPNLEFHDKAIGRLARYDDSIRRIFNKQFRLMDHGKMLYKDSIRDTRPTIYEIKAGYDYRIYCRPNGGAKHTILLVGHKGDQGSDCELLRGF